VNAPVFHETALPTKRFVTHVTLVWSFASVNASVHIKIAALTESLVAYVTSVRILAGVNASVRVEIPGINERLVARLARVRLDAAVNLFVSEKTVVVNESPVTLLAFVEFPSSVSFGSSGSASHPVTWVSVVCTSGNVYHFNSSQLTRIPNHLTTNVTRISIIHLDITTFCMYRTIMPQVVLFRVITDRCDHVCRSDVASDSRIHTVLRRINASTWFFTCCL